MQNEKQIEMTTILEKKRIDLAAQTIRNKELTQIMINAEKDIKKSEGDKTAIETRALGNKNALITETEAEQQRMIILANAEQQRIKLLADAELYKKLKEIESLNLMNEKLLLKELN